ncbi:ATP-binding protein [Oleidesulfovibrio alaskensis]|uniref:ATP-binding protein n=1 Tax=Oleidesulfovibrio alaskensis TaxID=58180 RepID=UPI001A633402|nr:ATP-binding protein [Oleidesulfovibrio alaskensis]MBL3582475.1 PAS domain S-box protein [Oleidesulfovibrio alaskensis]
MYSADRYPVHSRRKCFSCGMPGHACRLRAVCVRAVCAVWLIALYAAGAVAAPAVAAAAVGGAPARALLVSSYHPGFPTFFDQIAGLRSQLDAAGVLLDVEFMDSKRFAPEKVSPRFKNMLKRKLAVLPPYDIVFCADDNALQFMLEHGRELFPLTPCIFMGINNVGLAVSLRQDELFTGVVESVSVTQTLALVRQLFPQMTGVAVLVDGTPSGQGDLKTVLAAERDFPELSFSVISLQDMSWDAFGAALEKVPPTSAALLLSAYVDAAGERRTFESSLDFIAAHLRVPLLHLWEHGIGEGVLGGRVVSHHEQGRLAGMLGLRVMRGESAAVVPVVRGDAANRYIFDFRQLEKFGVRLSRLPEGSEIRYRSSTVWERNRWGIIIAVLVVLLQALVILMLHTSRRRLRDSEEELRLWGVVFRHAGWGIALGVGDDDRLTLVNPRYAEMHGYTVEEMQGMSVLELYPQREWAALKSQRARALADGRAEQESVHLRKDGSSFPAWVDISVVRGSSGGVTYRVVNVQDISERVRTQELLVETEKMMSVGGLAAGMAHEINNPLGIVLQSVQNMQRRLDPSLEANAREAAACGVNLENVQTYMERRSIMRSLEHIREAGLRAAEIVRNMLDFTRRNDAGRSTCDIAVLLEKVLMLGASDYDLSKKYDFRNIRIVKDIEADLPAVPCVRTEIEQVFFNIIRNGAEAMSEHPVAGRVPTLVICARRSGRWLLVAIRDNGPGMSGEVRRRVFEPFFTTKPAGRGTGLGLSVSYFIITRNHGGRIEVHSTPYEGSVFLVALPVSGQPAGADDAPDFPLMDELSRRALLGAG